MLSMESKDVRLAARVAALVFVTDLSDPACGASAKPSSDGCGGR